MSIADFSPVFVVEKPIVAQRLDALFVIFVAISVRTINQDFFSMQENTHNILPIKSRILDYLSAEGMTPAEFYRKSGITRGVLSQPNGISEENLLRFFLCFPDANPDWLISGRGSRKRNVPNCNSVNQEHSAIESSNSFLSGKVEQLREEREIFHKRNEELAGEVALLRHEVQRLNSQIEDFRNNQNA